MERGDWTNSSVFRHCAIEGLFWKKVYLNSSVNFVNKVKCKFCRWCKTFYSENLQGSYLFILLSGSSPFQRTSDDKAGIYSVNIIRLTEFDRIWNGICILIGWFVIIIIIILTTYPVIYHDLDGCFQNSVLKDSRQCKIHLDLILAGCLSMKISGQWWQRNFLAACPCWTPPTHLFEQVLSTRHNL